MTPRVGSVMSLFGTATGRAFAASLPASRLEQAPFAALGDTPATRPVSQRARRRELAEAIAEAVAEARMHGVSRAAGRPVPGVNAFSAAAFDHEGVPTIVITALDHQDRPPADWNGAPARAVREAAAAITVRLGGVARG